MPSPEGPVMRVGFFSFSVRAGSVGFQVIRLVITLLLPSTLPIAVPD